jgi:hypothetical protein
MLPISSLERSENSIGDKKMKTLMTVLALATVVVASPAFAKPHPDRQAPNATQQSSDIVKWRGSVRGEDPDWFVRYQILRDAQADHT